SDDGATKRAAAEAVAVLAGERWAPPAVELPPLASCLADCPFDPHVLIVVDQMRLPPPRALMALARAAGLAVTRTAIEAAGGTVSPAMWAGATMLAEAGGVLPYEVARRFGNHRIARTVIAVRLQPDA